MSIPTTCGDWFDCDARKNLTLDQLIRLLIVDDGSGCPALKTSDVGGGGGGTTQPTSIPAFDIEAGQESGFSDPKLVGSVDWIVRVNNTLLMNSEFSVNSVAGSITFSPALNIGDEVQIFIVY